MPNVIYIMQIIFADLTYYLLNIQSTLVISKLKGPSETLRDICTLVLGIGQENHNRLSEELNRLIIDCTIVFLLAMSNNIQQVP